MNQINARNSLKIWNTRCCLYEKARRRSLETHLLRLVFVALEDAWDGRSWTTANWRDVAWQPGTSGTGLLLKTSRCRRATNMASRIKVPVSSSASDTLVSDADCRVIHRGSKTPSQRSKSPDLDQTVQPPSSTAQALGRRAPPSIDLVFDSPAP